MTRFLLRVAIFLGTAAVGLLLAAWALTDLRLSVSGFVIAVVIFVVAQSLFTPLLTKVADKHASALVGMVGLVSTLLALILATLLSNGLSIRGLSTWILAALIMWVVTALGAWLLPKLLIKDRPAPKS